MLDAVLTVVAGERRVFVIAPKSVAARAPLAWAGRLQAITRAFWDAVEAVDEQLRVGDHVHLYLTEEGLPGGQGTFLICSFWLVDALMIRGRTEVTRALFERLLTKANDVELYAEEVDPISRTVLSNYPQAFTHPALINSATQWRLHEEGGAEALSGTHADRSKRAAGRMVHKQALRRDTIEVPEESESKRSILYLRDLLEAGPHARSPRGGNHDQTIRAYRYRCGDGSHGSCSADSASRPHSGRYRLPTVWRDLRPAWL
ncbi:hypothetical protein [Pseudomonas sp. SCT]|uniref:hypothetical protein n=1 Tax=Pseudomonas sp. (strain SCT) TaxID=412955 RepID=UPI0021156083|nr:hypothetical protein [Pseudomonas sp. SCT]